MVWAEEGQAQPIKRENSIKRMIIGECYFGLASGRRNSKLQDTRTKEIPKENSKSQISSSK
jgi:hypothetical protein